jgi:hypothetical protein
MYTIQPLSPTTLTKVHILSRDISIEFDVSIDSWRKLILGAAFDTLVILLVYSTISVAVVMLLAIWRSVLAGTLKTSLLRRKPLLVPSLVFIITTLVISTYYPLPMSVYHGPHQRDVYFPTEGRFTVFETIAYDDAQIRIRRSLEIDEWVEFFANFSQDGAVIQFLAVNITYSDLDENYMVNEILSLEPGLYDFEIAYTFYESGIIQEDEYLDILLYQPIKLSFLPEVTDWASYQFLLGFGLVFLFLAGVFIGREEKSRESEELVDQEPPRDETYAKRFKV